ncbi:hypothetical protein [Streptomyces sp. NPDC054887]
MPDGWTVTLYEHADYTGEHLALVVDTPKLPDALHVKESSTVVAEPSKSFAHYLDAGDDHFYFEDSVR